MKYAIKKNKNMIKKIKNKQKNRSYVNQCGKLYKFEQRQFPQKKFIKKKTKTSIGKLKGRINIYFTNMMLKIELDVYPNVKVNLRPIRI